MFLAFYFCSTFGDVQQSGNVFLQFSICQCLDPSSDETGNTSNKTASFVPVETLLRILPLSLTYLLYMLASMESVRAISVPMYTTLRRTTVVFTMVVEYLLTRQMYAPFIVGSVSLTVFGAFIAGARDLSYDSYGYAIVFVANITTAVYLATVARLGKSSGLNSFGLMWCNGVICAPLLLIWTFASGDLERTISFPHLYSPSFLVVLLLSCMMAFLLNYTVFLNTTVNSALTQTVCGNLKVRLCTCKPFIVVTLAIMAPLSDALFHLWHSRISSQWYLAGYCFVGFLMIHLMLLDSALVSLALACMLIVSSMGSSLWSAGAFFNVACSG
uniref:UDP-N-acetylglucosamine transporter UGNT1 isoform X2 n=1 Tax=Elaeis guineensis var. tenera TaxID=51953 RepID=A0A8N4EQQ0_ELAGV|nr:UDP-N-acetylglucosamine transporter UGNT1 isoform X2 [Elaeis guineensis]